MTTQEATRVLTQEEAVAKLEAAGYTRQPCAHCNCTGYHTIINDGGGRRLCSRCEGAGKIWSPPKPAQT